MLVVVVRFADGVCVCVVWLQMILAIQSTYRRCRDQVMLVVIG